MRDQHPRASTPHLSEFDDASGTRETVDHPAAGEPPLDAKRYQKLLSRYHTPRVGRGMIELAITIVPLVILWFVAWYAYHSGHVWLTLLIAVANAGFLVRLFIIQHDCGHGSFLPGRHANNAIGRVLGVLTWTPYDYWRHTHAMHHAGSGNLDRRGMGDVTTMTVEEYQGLPRWGRWRYRLYRHPLVLFGLGPAYLFLIRNRFPAGLMRAGWRPWLSTMLTNLGIIALMCALAWLVGVKALLFVHGPIVLLAASFGVWLFYVQHQYEHTQWQGSSTWHRHDAALYGSSNYQMPGVLRWFTVNVGVHHVHHLCSQIPCYRLPQVLREHPELRSIGVLTFRSSFRTVRLALWDEAAQRLVSFAAAAGHRRR